MKHIGLSERELMDDLEHVATLERKQIGTVKLLRDRVYGEVSVPAGTYPVIEDDGEIYFQFTGYPIIAAGNFESHGNGLYSVSDGDRSEA